MITINYTPSRTSELFHNDRSKVKCILGPVGCLSSSHEVMTRDGWVGIADWAGQDILVSDANGATHFEQPRDYISAPCDLMYRFSSRGLLMDVTPNHTVLHHVKFNKGTARTLDAQSIVDKHKSLRGGWDGLIPSGFTFPINAVGVNLTDEALRVMVMACADGHFPKGYETTRCVVTVAKPRKVARARELLTAAGIAFVEKVYPSRPLDTTFIFTAPEVNKRLAAYKLCNATQAAVIVDEMVKWDGHTDHNKSLRYYSNFKEDADFAAYLFNASGRRSAITKYTYPDKPNWSDSYSVTSPKRNSYGIRSDYRKVLIQEIVPEDGKQYCFETSTGFFVTRNGDCTIITGNSGKSVTCVMECLFHAMSIPPLNNIRESRIAVVRSTYGELKETTIKTWDAWLGDMGKFRYDSPIKFDATFPLGDGTIVDMQVSFFPLDQPKDVKKLRSAEYTMMWINEGSLVEADFMGDIAGRLRYKTVQFGNALKAGLIPEAPYRPIVIDTNPPTTKHWIHKKFEEDRLKGYRIFKQPGGLIKNPDGTYDPNPLAENVSNYDIGYDYYYDQMVGMTQDKINVLILGQYGSTFDGQPVYDSSWVNSEHVSDAPLLFNRSLPLVVGMDWGMSPAASFMQMSPTGQLLILDELAPHDVTLEQFITEHLRPKLINRFPGANPLIIGDPAGAQRSSLSTQNAFEIVRSYGYMVDAAPTQDPIMRREAVTHFLLRRSKTGPSLLVSRQHCPVTIDGFDGGYKFAKLGAGQGYREVPDKNEYSHCFVGSTLVQIEGGYKRIDEITVGDRVVTPFGLREVTDVMSRMANSVVSVSDGTNNVTCTPNHRFFGLTGRQRIDMRQSHIITKDTNIWVAKAVLSASSIKDYGISIVTKLTGTLERSGLLPPYFRGLCGKTLGEKFYLGMIRSPSLTGISTMSFPGTWSSLYGRSTSTKSSTVSGFTLSAKGTMSRTIPSVRGICTAMFGRMLTAPYQMGTISTTLTGINPIIPYLIYKSSARLNTQDSTSESGWPKIKTHSASASSRPEKRLNYGTPAMRAGSGIASTANGHGKTVLKLSRYVRSAIPVTRLHEVWLRRAFAPPSASPLRGGLPGWTTFLQSAKDAVRRFSRTSTVHVSGVSSVPQRVYDLTVEADHCYYAGGFLVSNCHDAIQYGALHFYGDILRQKKQRDRPKATSHPRRTFA